MISHAGEKATTKLMNCAYHIKNSAVVQCSSCGRPLCPACDHRIRGFPFCQDCIVTGVGLLQQHRARANSLPVAGRKTSPFIAALLSFVPGLGAAYNGQTSKAIVHFAIFASFFQMAVLTGLPFFVLGIIGAWLFAAVDAHRTAQLIRAGLAPDAEGDAIARRLYGHPFAWGMTLIVLGTIFFLHTLLGIQLPVRQFLPVALIALGAYMLFDYFRRRHNRERRVQAFDTHRPPPSVVSSPLDVSRLGRIDETVTHIRGRER
jgi:hypothetical protein